MLLLLLFRFKRLILASVKNRVSLYMMMMRIEMGTNISYTAKFFATIRNDCIEIS